jgi:hypothetical protein
MDFRVWVEKYPKMVSSDLALKAIKEVPEMLVAYIADRIDHLRRGDLRDREIQDVAPILRAMGSSAPPILSRRDLKTGEMRQIVLPVEPFSLGDGTKVSWADATIEQHMQRITILRKIAQGTEASIQRHKMAIKRIKAAGVTCLREAMKKKKAA